MTKAKVNFWLDVALLCVLITVIVTGYAMEHNSARLRFRSGFIGGYSPAVEQSSSSEPLTTIHIVSALALLSGVSIHLALHLPCLRVILHRRNSGTSAQLTNTLRQVSLLFIACTLTGLSGLLHARGWHEISGAALIVVVVAHLIAHRKWIAACVQRYAFS